MVNSQERVATVLAGGVPDRVPRATGYWSTTVERWRREGSTTRWLDFTMKTREDWNEHRNRIYSVDHGVPNDVPFDNYCYAMELVEHYGAYG